MKTELELKQMLIEYEKEVIDELVDDYTEDSADKFVYDDEFVYTTRSIKDKNSDDYYNISTAMNLETYETEAVILKNGELQNENRIHTNTRNRRINPRN